MMHSAPTNATQIAAACTGLTFSCRNHRENRIAANGESLLSIEASDRSRRSMA